MLLYVIIPEPTARSAVPGEGTNSAPGEGKTLAKSKVHE